MTPKGLIRLGRAVLARMKVDNVSLLASAIAFWGMLALVPALVALVSLYGLVADPAEVERQVRESTQALPAEAQQLIVAQLRAVVAAPSAGLGTGLVIGLAVALFAASAGMRTLITAVGVVYGDRAGDKGFVTERGKALGLTLGGIAFIAAAVLVVALIPSHHLLWVIQWVVLAAGLVLGLGILYRLGPTRNPEPRLLSPGAIVAAVLVVAVTMAFSLYTSRFSSYNETYGSLAAVVILLLWLQLSAMTILIGATLNRELAAG